MKEENTISVYGYGVIQYSKHDFATSEILYAQHRTDKGDINYMSEVIPRPNDLFDSEARVWTLTDKIPEDSEFIGVYNIDLKG